MKQELTIPDQESNIDIKIGDMFRWTDGENKGDSFIYLGEEMKCVILPFSIVESRNSYPYVDLFIINKQEIVYRIHDGMIERLPKGTTFTITQE